MKAETLVSKECGIAERITPTSFPNGTLITAGKRTAGNRRDRDTKVRHSQGCQADVRGIGETHSAVSRDSDDVRTYSKCAYYDVQVYDDT